MCKAQQQSCNTPGMTPAHWLIPDLYSFEISTNKRWFQDNVHFPAFRALGSSLLTALLQFLGANPDGPLCWAGQPGPAALTALGKGSCCGTMGGLTLGWTLNTKGAENKHSEMFQVCLGHWKCASSLSYLTPLPSHVGLLVVSDSSATVT